MGVFTWLSGIGYFTLPYLVHAGAAHVHACEWNPDAVSALRRNLQINKVAHRCTVHEGDNKQVRTDLSTFAYRYLVEFEVIFVDRFFRGRIILARCYYVKKLKK